MRSQEREDIHADVSYTARVQAMVVATYSGTAGAVTMAQLRRA